MLGTQLPTVLELHASELGIPTFRQFMGNSNNLDQAYPRYKQELDQDINKWWCAEAQRRIASIVWPFPYSSVLYLEGCPAALLGTIGAPWRVGLQAFSWAHFQASIVQLGATRAGKPTTNPTAPCLACGDGRGGNFAHIVLCPALSSLHTALDAQYQCKSVDLPIDGWSRAKMILDANDTLLQERVIFCADLEKALLSCVEAKKQTPTGTSVSSQS